jgi:hypothetical protein
LGVHPDSVDAFEVTRISCLPAWTATRSPKADDPEAREFKGAFASGEERFRLEAGTSSDRVTLTRQDAMGRMVLTRITSLPSRCRRPHSNTPLYNFDVLWTTFAELYPSFAAHGVSWQEVNHRLRSQVRTAVTPESLFQLFVEMLEPLHDSHVVLERFPEGTSLKKAWLKTAAQSFQGRRQDGPPLTEAAENTARRIIRTIP